MFSSLSLFNNLSADFFVPLNAFFWWCVLSTCKSFRELDFQSHSQDDDVHNLYFMFTAVLSYAYISKDICFWTITVLGTCLELNPWMQNQQMKRSDLYSCILLILHVTNNAWCRAWTFVNDEFTAHKKVEYKMLHLGRETNCSYLVPLQCFF